MSKWVATLLVIGFLLCMPLWIPAAFLLRAVDKYRLRKAAKFFACVSCGRILGLDALARPDEEWSEHVRELRRQHPGVRFRLERTVHAICPTCGTRFGFREKERTFVLEDPSPSGVRAYPNAAAAGAAGMLSKVRKWLGRGPGH